MIDQQGIPRPADLQPGNQLVEAFHIQGGPQEVVGTVVQLMLHGNDQVRHPAISQEDVADIMPFLDCLLEPFLVPVIFPGQGIRTGIGPLVAFGIDDPQVHKPPEALFQVFQSLLQLGAVPQIPAGMEPGDKMDGRQPFFQEKGHRPSGIGDQPGRPQSDFRLDPFPGGPVVQYRHKDQRQQGNSDGPKNGQQPDPPKIEQVFLRTGGHIVMVPEFRFEFFQQAHSAFFFLGGLP